MVFAESAPADLVPPSRAPTAPLARAYSMAPQTSPTSLKRANKGGAGRRRVAAEAEQAAAAEPGRVASSSVFV